MSPDKESLQQRASQIEQEQEQLRLVKLSNKSIILAVIISLLIPIGGYIYTGRWKPMFILLGSLTVLNTLILMGSRNEREGFASAFSTSAILSTIIAPIDNGSAIKRAKDKIRQVS